MQTLAAGRFRFYLALGRIPIAANRRPAIPPFGRANIKVLNCVKIDQAIFPYEVPKNRLPIKNTRQPKEQIHPDFAGIDFVEHFVPASGIEVVRDVDQASLTVAIHQIIHPF
jgi:hypothetical protein